MPRKNRNAYNEYMQKYMQEYREKKKRQMQRLRKAIEQGKIDLAKQILDTKPSINIWGKPEKKKKTRGK